ncbi:DMT family transporter [Methylopila sp. M107]|uniref:DMT family transporter n=1 Tax=Methylopila sp. M107 TaxID=1101190 RepID=UPI001FD9A88A|nr:DMT family transporter [Methylopila sp. M107]
MPGTPSLDRADAALYATLVLVWGTSWIAIRHQLGEVSPVVSLLWRFALSAAICFAIAAWRGETLVHPARRHLWFALAGVTMFSTNFLLFYLAGRHVPTGLLAVVFALASPINLGLAALFFKKPVEGRVLLGAAIGVTGVALLYAPEILGTGFDLAALGGLGLAVLGTFSFCLGNMASSVIQRDDVPDIAATAWGMGYGALWLLTLSLTSGAAFAFDWRAPYVLSLVWLALGSSVAAFIAYLALIKRIGPARAGFATVLFPVVALGISSVFEDYHWGPLAMLGVALVAVGNVVVLGLAGRKAATGA